MIGTAVETQTGSAGELLPLCRQIEVWFPEPGGAARCSFSSRALWLNPEAGSAIVSSGALILAACIARFWHDRSLVA